jgi:mono/diheme cytochrome c family protein
MLELSREADAMKNIAQLAILCAAPALVAACDEKKATPPAEAAAPPAVDAAAAAPPAPDPKVVARGDYLVNVVMNCAACHTPLGPEGPDMSKRFAGGLEFPEPFGTWRSANITQDKKTGIGGWTDEQIAAAIREGKRPNGDKLYPVMPYTFYHVLSDNDTKAVVAYLRTIPPIENAVEGTKDLKLPKPELPKPSGAEPGSAPAEKGAYLATLMHCGQCHTPMDPKTFAPLEDKPMAGGQKFEMPPVFGKGDLYAANITPDKKTGIGTWTDDHMRSAITELKKKDGKPIMGPMSILGMNWGKMEKDDVDGVVAWLKDLKPVANKVPKSTFKPSGPPPPPAGDTVPGGAAAPTGTEKAE